MSELKTNVLYFGDNLDILRKYIPDNSIDLIYLDPPFNSKKDYNILFKENGGVESEAQIKAFTDTWHWTQTAQDAYHEILTKGPLKVGKLIDALHDAIGGNDVMAYLVMMTIRLVELHRVLKSTGSLYLHCDPTASHYLKLVLDQVFGIRNFRNEIVWCYTDRERPLPQWNRKHDILLFYSKDVSTTRTFNWQAVAEPYSEVTLKKFRYSDELGPYRIRGNNIKGSPYRALTDLPYHTLEESPDLVYKDRPSEGVAPRDWWIIPFINQAANERLGYPTQKPLTLLERIIKASSNEEDVVLDPFCGCGTAVVAAQKLNRHWLGIDVTHLAINLMRNRLKDSFGIKAEVIGEPKDLAGANALSHQQPDGRYQFQWWALGLIGARPLGEKKKGADQGIDGIIPFIDDPAGKASRIIVQVKSGHVGVNAIRELKAVAANDAIGVFITLEPATAPMKVEAIDAGYYHSELYDKDYPKIQILTIEELLQSKTVDMPPQTQTSVTFTKAQKITRKEGVQPAMGRLKFNMGDIVIGNDKKASFRDRKGTVIGYEPRTHEYLVRFDDGRNEYVNPSWLNHGVKEWRSPS
ncbi:DNA methyltransferase [Chloroflexota bacterium]